MSKKRLRDDGDDRSSSQTSTIFPPSIIPFNCGIVTASDRGDSATVDFPSNGLSDENGMDIYHDSTATYQLAQSSYISTTRRISLKPAGYYHLPVPHPWFGLDLGTHPGRLNGFTTDANNNFNNNNHPSTQTAPYSSPINQNHHSTTTDPAGPSEADQLTISENALRTLSLVSSSNSGASDKLFRFVEPVGYESVPFSHTHTVVDDHYTHRGGKYALPPSPHSFSSPEDEQGDDVLDIVDQEVLRRARGPLLVHVSKKLMRAIDPREKVARTLFNSPIRTSDSQQSFSRAEPLTSSTIAIFLIISHQCNKV
ncbi:hypothetical protein PGTUg99_003664 [Puccinia graminis f. sp. tritici]|uniref:Uncharacterized protein n=1 Tax=Puccinia graminis f. sp. tritici TaxID=56615 RepID=A0A5B0RGX5_PUCGR|nr:hypothetical protein PGTUg99_003664 [Puccinia graminis f. sp. tritici]